MSPGRTCIAWSDGELWKRADPKPEAASGALHGQTDARKQPSLTLEQALNMQDELQKGFSNTAFQMKLSELQRKFPKNGAQFMSARTELFLEVQSAVLPRYGFEGTQRGVIQMLAAAARWNGNKDFCRKR